MLKALHTFPANYLNRLNQFLFLNSFMPRVWRLECDVKYTTFRQQCQGPLCVQACHLSDRTRCRTFSDIDGLPTRNSATTLTTNPANPSPVESVFPIDSCNRNKHFLKIAR